jgi:hypothetical protein
VEDVHGIDLFEGAAVGFADEEVDYYSTEETAGGEDISVLIIDGSRDVGRD